MNTSWCRKSPSMSVLQLAVSPTASPPWGSRQGWLSTTNGYNGMRLSLDEWKGGYK